MNEMTHRRTLRARAAAATMICFASSTPLLAQTVIDVTNANDSGAGSLRDAITQANAVNTGSVIINVENPSAITLTSGELQLTTAVPVTINADNSTISGSNTSRIIEVDMRFWYGKEEFREVHVQRAYELTEIGHMLGRAGFTQVRAFHSYTLNPPRHTSDRVHIAAIKK